MGGLSGYFGGTTDLIIQRLIEFIQSVPSIPLWIGLAAAIPQAANALPGQQVAPLPPPIEIRPAPGVKSSRPRAPLVIAPPVPNTGRPGF